MSNEQKEIQKPSKEEVIVSKDVGVYFDGRANQDDYKSRLLTIFSKDKKQETEPKKVWPLKSINFEGHHGEILGIIGSNGAGKTTLSKIITGILQNDKGTMDVNGKVTALFSFGMGFNKELTGRENIYLNGMMLGIDKELINEYIDDIHTFSELGDFIDQPMKYYSSGMKSRLGFSVAAHLQPEVLILDEALNTGDAKFGKKAADKMKELVTQAKMVIIVTHSLPYAQRNCDRLMWIDKGEVREIGDPKAVIAKYRASVPMPIKKKRSLELTKTETNVLSNPVIKTTNLGVSFNLRKGGKHWALKDLNFTIYEGEVVGIIGHNGAGKSTLCKVMTGILAPDQGMVKVYGETSSLLGYGTGFNPQLTGTDNIYLNGMLLGIPKETIDAKYDEIVEFSGVKKRIDKPMKHYSSGMRARLGFSIAAVLQPDVFIIDEALSTGDLEFRQKATERIQEMMESAKAVVIVSHSMNFVEKVCTRAIWIDRGQVRMDGKAEDVVDEYRKAMGVPKQRKMMRKQLAKMNNGAAKRNPNARRNIKQKANKGPNARRNAKAGVNADAKAEQVAKTGKNTKTNTHKNAKQMNKGATESVAKAKKAVEKTVGDSTVSPTNPTEKQPIQQGKVKQDTSQAKAVNINNAAGLTSKKVMKSKQGTDTEFAETAIYSAGTHVEQEQTAIFNTLSKDDISKTITYDNAKGMYNEKDKLNHSAKANELESTTVFERNQSIWPKRKLKQRYANNNRPAKLTYEEKINLERLEMLGETQIEVESTFQPITKTRQQVKQERKRRARLKSKANR